VWLAKLTEKGLLRPSFVPPQQIRVLRDYTRLRVDLTAERTRHWQRLEKLLEDALIKITAGLVPYPAVQPGPQHVQFCLSGSRDALLRPGSLRTGYVEIHINGSKRAGG